MTYLREYQEQTVLMHVSRATHEPLTVRLRDFGLRGRADIWTLHGQDLTDDAAGTVSLPATGPAAHAYAWATPH